MTGRSMDGRAAIASLVGITCALGTPSAHAGDLPALTTELVVDGLVLPVGMAAPRGVSERLWVLEQSGLVHIVQDGGLLPTPFLDLSSTVLASGEQGLLDLAFHPQYGSNGRLFVTYNDLDGDIVLEEWAVDPFDPDVALAGSGQRLLEIPKPFPQHNGGALVFGLDGTLHMSTGDGGGGGDPLNLAASLDSLLGKVLRLDVDGAAPYAVPADNPFVGVPGALPEIWASGLRNPWRMGLDIVTGDLYLGDVGQELREEVDVIPAGVGGLDFGWRCLEGTLCTNAAGCVGCPAPTSTPPVHEYAHGADGCAIIGGHVYRGVALPEFAGRYFFADYCVGKVWSLLVEDGVATDLREHTTELTPAGGFLGLISSFGRDGRGELYTLSLFPGELRRIVRAPPVADCDGDGTPDADEIAAGAPDVNANGVPDSCELVLSASPLIPGDVLDIEFLGAEPGDPVGLFYTTRGVGPGPCLLGVCLDLLPFGVGGIPQVPLLALMFADVQGVAALNVPIPDPFPPETFYFQAVLVQGGLGITSNTVISVVGS